MLGSKEQRREDDAGAFPAGVHGSCGVSSRSQFLLPCPFFSFGNPCYQFLGICCLVEESRNISVLSSLHGEEKKLALKRHADKIYKRKIGVEPRQPPPPAPQLRPVLHDTLLEQCMDGDVITSLAFQVQGNAKLRADHQYQPVGSLLITLWSTSHGSPTTLVQLQVEHSPLQVS
ncbi:hypothetical protein Pfo_023355 [Paulownia fortunei]|nr:hypothetical protein Pfo_023355 [Paulownia fortunei]